MAFKLAEAVVDIKANDKDLEAKLAGAKSKLGKFFDSVKSMALPLAGIIGAAVVAKLANAVGDAAKSAGDLNETLSKTNVVFGDASGAVVKFADDMHAKFGSVKNDVLGAAADIGIVGKAIKLNAAESAAFSIQLVKLADDAASLHNVGLADALDRIKAALRGESDPIEKLGVMMNETAVNTEVLRLGLAKTTGEITNAMKIQARYSLIVQGLKDATGDHARTQNEFNGQLKEFQDRLSGLGTAIGQMVLPFFTKLLQVVNPVLQAIEQVINRIMGIPAATQTATSKLAGDAAKAEKIVAGGNPFSGAAEKAQAARQAGDVSFIKAAGYDHMLLNIKGQDGKVGQQLNPVFQHVADDARTKTEGLLSTLKEKGLTAIDGMRVLKEGIMSTAIKGINTLAEKPKVGGGGISDVDSFNRDLQAGALNTEKAAEETAKNTATMATLLGNVRDLLSTGKIVAQAIMN